MRRDLDRCRLLPQRLCAPGRSPGKYMEMYILVSLNEEIIVYNVCVNFKKNMLFLKLYIAIKNVIAGHCPKLHTKFQDMPVG